MALAVLGPGVASAQAASITLEASETNLKPKQTTDLSGTLSGTFGSASGKTVTLYATPYPYEADEVADTTTTGNGGKFSFKNVDPALNTRYRVAFDGNILEGDATSDTVRINRSIRENFDLRITADGFAKGRIDLFYSRKGRARVLRRAQGRFLVLRQDLRGQLRPRCADPVLRHRSRSRERDSIQAAAQPGGLRVLLLPVRGGSGRGHRPRQRRSPSSAQAASRRAARAAWRPPTPSSARGPLGGRR